MCRKAQRLPRAEAEKSPPYQRILEKPEGSVLQVPFEIDEDVAAGDQMNFGEHLVRDEAVVRKNCSFS